MTYDVILADPPWKYDVPTPKRRIENHYKTISLALLCDLEIPSASNSVLYLWATTPLLLDALKVIEAWGFKYKSHAIWDKGSPGMGYWFRGQHELLIVAAKGKIKPPPPDMRCGSILRYPAQNRLARINGKCNAHSRKPWEVRAMISRWYPGSRKLEMFARDTEEGWDVFGNEVENSIKIDMRPRVDKRICPNCDWFGSESNCLDWKHSTGERFCPECHEVTEMLL